MNKNIENFYIEWIANLEAYLSGYAFDKDNQPIKTRFAYLTLQKHLTDLLSDSLAEDQKIIILPGIRGVGKTTLLSQLYFFEQFLPKGHARLNEKLNKLDYRIYISADRLISENISLQDFTRYLENNIWGNLSLNKKKILFLIDEVQYDSKWDLFLKLLFDKTKGNNNILIIATGSSAIFLNQKNNDLVRRSKMERILPERFVEYLMLHHNIYPEKGLTNSLRDAIFNSDNAVQVFNKLNSLKPIIIKKLATIPNLELNKLDYFIRGSLPFATEMASRSQALERIKNMVLINIVQRDLILSGDFDAETLVKIPDTLFLLANSDEITTGNLANTLKIHSNTINKILKSLVDTEILYEVKPYGQPYNQIKKSPKYLFVSSALRSGLLDGIFGSNIKGKLLEDYMALIFSRELYNKAKIFFDYGKGGADFIVRFQNNREIVIEVGFGKEDTRQVMKTIAKTNERTKYGLTIGSKQLELINDKIVKIPLNYFLLM